MTVARSTAALTASRVYLALLGLIVLPQYLKLLGADAFGLVALFVVLQAWFQLLDCGLIATLAREVARYRGGAITGDELRALIRSVERLFACGLMVIAVLLGAASYSISSEWLQLGDMSQQDARLTLQLMAMCLAIRMLGELNRAAVSGFERLAWLAGYSAIFGSARLLGVLPWLAVVEATAVHFFLYQLMVTALETTVCWLHVKRLLPKRKAPPGALHAQPLRAVFGFSFSMTMASAVWVLASQIDKVLLSGMLSLADYGAFSLAVSAAAGVLVATSSLADALIPRLVRMQVQKTTQVVRDLYRGATQWTAIMAATGAAFLAANAERLLWVWTGDPSLAAQMALVLTLYAVGNAAMALGAMPYYLQLAQGRLRYHLVGTGLLMGLMVPGLLWTTPKYGAVGAGFVWMTVNILYLVGWTPMAHRQVLPGGHRNWLLRDVLPIAMSAAIAAYATRSLSGEGGRAGAAVQLIVAVVITATAAAAGSSVAREWLRRPFANTPPASTRPVE